MNKKLLSIAGTLNMDSSDLHEIKTKNTLSRIKNVLFYPLTFLASLLIGLIYAASTKEPAQSYGGISGYPFALVGFGELLSNKKYKNKILLSAAIVILGMIIGYTQFEPSTIVYSDAIDYGVYSKDGGFA